MLKENKSIDFGMFSVYLACYRALSFKSFFDYSSGLSWHIILSESNMIPSCPQKLLLFSLLCSEMRGMRIPEQCGQHMSSLPSFPAPSETAMSVVLSMKCGVKLEILLLFLIWHFSPRNLNQEWIPTLMRCRCGICGINRLAAIKPPAFQVSLHSPGEIHHKWIGYFSALMHACFPTCISSKRDECMQICVCVHEHVWPRVSVRALTFASIGWSSE